MNLVGEWSRVLARSLSDAGVSHVVVSPGSRSTPFVLAIEAEPRLEVTVVIDERAAAFFALGRARVLGRPVALLCTSGTAAANYLPAVAEADAAGVPLVVLTADRPLSLMSCGANQSMEQLSLFQGRTRFSLDVGAPVASLAAMRAMRRVVTRAVAEAMGDDPGPVHLDLRADKPLEPGPAVTDEDRAAERASAEVLKTSGTSVGQSERHPSRATVERLAARIAAARRPVLVAGPRLPNGANETEALLDFCRASGLHLLAESTSQHRFVGRRRDGISTLDSFDLAWRTPSGRRALRPDLVIQVGAYPVSRGYADLVEGDDAPARIVLCDRAWPDPSGTAEEVVRTNLAILFGALAAEATPAVRDDAFVERVSRAEAALAHAVETVIGNGQLGEGAVARALVSAMPVGSVLVVGNSLPVRQLDLVCPGRLGDFTVVSQRGVSGIDGLIAGAAGAAAAARRPTVAYVGDVSFLHDVGGLLTARGLGTPFCIVVANNDGGRIFEQLPVARLDLSSSSLARFTTPHGLSFGDAASLYGHRYAKAETPSSLRDAIDAALAQPGCTVVEALVPSSAARTEADALRAAAESALAVLDPETHG